ncbi:DsrE/DsrF/DrsH-like family protein [Planococcus chinensis]|nr:DsrE/DsrF/DrsH-like family protein [Planococcus chinensis]
MTSPAITEMTEMAHELDEKLIGCQMTMDVSWDLKKSIH